MKHDRGLGRGGMLLPQAIGTGGVGLRGSWGWDYRCCCRGPGASPGHPTDGEWPSGVGGVHRVEVSPHGPPQSLWAGPAHLGGGERVTGAGGHGAGGAVAQALMAGASRARVDDGPRPWGGQRVGLVGLPAHLPLKARGLVDLEECREVHDVIVAMRDEVRGGLPGLVAVLQQDGGARLIRRPAAFVICPLPIHPTPQGGRLGEQAPTNGPHLPWVRNRVLLLSSFLSKSKIYIYYRKYSMGIVLTILEFRELTLCTDMMY